MKSRNFWAVLCLFALFALPAVAQDWVQKQMITLPGKINFNSSSQMMASDGTSLFFANTFPKLSNNTYPGGEVYIYELENSIWLHKQTITFVNPEPSKKVTLHTSMNGDFATIGFHPYKVQIFRKINGAWQYIQEITTSNITTNLGGDCAYPSLGINTYIKNNFLFLTSYCSTSGVQGAVHIYKLDDNGNYWTPYRLVKQPCWCGLLYLSNFGKKVDLLNGWLVVSSFYWVHTYKFQDILENTSNIDIQPIQTIQDANGYTNPYNNDENQSWDSFLRYSSQISSYSKTFANFIVEADGNLKRISEKKVPIINPNNNSTNYAWNNRPTASFNDKYFFWGNFLLTAPMNNQPYWHWYHGVKVFKKIGQIWAWEHDVVPLNKIAGMRIGEAIDMLNNNNILVSGFDNSVNPLDTVSVIYHFQKTRGNLIKGKVFHDANANCQKEAGEVGKEYYSIKAEPGGYITSTDENGNYELEVGAGTYTISQVIPQAKGLSVTQLCPAGAGTHTVTFNGLNNEISGYDFGNDVKECTLLTVDVTSRRRRCFRNQTIVKYENEGVATANNAYITVTFPEYVIPLSSTNPWVSKVGNTYKFNVGTLTAGQRGQFVVTDSVACVAGIQGLIQCTEAKIYPKNTCASPTWSGAILEIVGKCLNVAPHKGRFVLRNTGTASMQSSYKIWRGNTLILNNLLTLAQGDSLVLEIPTNNENVFMQANQATGHPDGETVSAMVMNCGNDLITSPNLQMMILPNDEYANSELDCMPIVDSYDPNDKAVSPAGITENNYVKPNTELEFKIRFQNMGTAEAVNIVVIDTLSQHLDLTTFQQMSVSHAYKLKFERVNGKQVAFWTFTDINLPAKSVNEPASHGYIKFKIKHLPTIAEGTIIKNFADIYFDFNEPVRTNETDINMTDYQFPVNPVDYCNLFAKAQAGQARTVCGNSHTLEGNLPTMGQGTWTRISGAGEIVEPHKSNSLVTNLGVGENVFRWTLTGVPDCANTESLVTIKRLPLATLSVSNNASNNIACAEENITFSAQTNNVGNTPVYQWKVDNQNVGTNSPTFNTNTLQNQDKVTVEVQTNLDCINAPKITSQPIEMTIKAKPAKPVISHTALYELKSSVEGDSYAWYKDNMLITNNLPTLKVQKLGKYKVVVTQNGCSSPTSDEFMLNSEALKRFADLVKVETYPNPTTGKFTLNITNNQGSEVTVQFYNSLGQLLTEQRVEASEDIDCKVSIDFTHYKQGVYYAKIVNQYGLQTTQKIVIQKQ